MNIVKQHQEVKLRANKINSNHYTDLKPSQIDSFLNDAALFICNHWGELETFQGTQFNKDAFGTLLITYPDQPELVPISNGDGQYEINLNGLKYKYLHLDRTYVQCGTQVVPISLMRGDEQHKFNDAYQEPSFKWKRLLGKIGKSTIGQYTSLYIYSDVDLTSKKIRLEYVKYPRLVYFGGYDSIEYINCRRINNVPNPPVGEDCNVYYKIGDAQVSSDLPEGLHSLQVDIACFLITGKTENQFLANFLNNKIQMLPK